MITAIGIKDKTGFRVVNSGLFREECERLSPGRYRLTVKKYSKEKSNQQLAYYYACVLPMSHRLLLDAGWEFASLEEVDVFWKSQFANREIVNRNSGEVMEIPSLKRHMTTTDMMAFVDSIRNYCSEYLGGYIPEPEQQIEMQL